jgi:nucleotide-binding universal stress UspA family protein
MKSILLHLQGGVRGLWVIDLALTLARRHAARLRGVTIADTRRMESIAANAESALSIVSEQTRMHVTRKVQESAHTDFSQACLAAGVDFDVRRMTGNVRDLLLSEAQLHDLLIAPCVALEAGDHSELAIAPRDLVNLLRAAPVPVLIPRGPIKAASRVLMVYDGTAESSRLIRSFVKSPLYVGGTHRLLAVGKTEREAQHALRGVADYCRAAGMDCELGWAVGNLRSVVLPFARKWEADLVVLGTVRGSPLVRRILGDVAEDVLTETPCGLYMAG